MDKATCSPLLDLPAELRLEIFGYVIPDIPLEEPRSHYIGLLYACKQTKAEIEPKILKNMQTALAGIAKECLEIFGDDIVFEPPRTMHELENLRIDARIPWNRAHRWRHPIFNFLKLRFNTLNVRLAYKQDGSELRPRKILTRWITECFMEHHNCGQVRVNVVDFDWSESLIDPRSRFRQISRADLRDVVREQIWKHEIRTNEQGQQVGIRFERPLDPSTLTIPGGCNDVYYSEGSCYG